MSEEKQTKLSEEDFKLLNDGVHQSLSSSITFAEVVHIINNMLIQEVQDRVGKMSDEEQDKALGEIKKAIEEAEKQKLDKEGES